MIRPSLSVALLLVSPLGAAAAQEQWVTAYLVAPEAVVEAQRLEELKGALPAQKAKWRRRDRLSLSYVVRQRTTTLLAPDPCERLPIRVTISKGKLQSAKYDQTLGECRKGDDAPRSVPFGSQRLFTPAEFFDRVTGAEAEIACFRMPSGGFCNTMRVTFHESLGIPTKIETFSPGVADYYWSLEVFDIEVLP